MQGEAVWTTNPSRLTMFGPTHEVVVFRDDVSGRLRRNALTLRKEAEKSREEGVDGRDTTAEEQEYTMSGTLPSHEEPQTQSQPTETDDDAPEAMDIDDVPPSPAAKNAQPPQQALPSSSARALTKTLLDQSHLSPFPLSLRPQHWSFGHALSLYPLPTALVLCDAETEAFACVYQGCCVVNAGKLVSGGIVSGNESARAGGGLSGRDQVSWCEVDVVEGRGRVRML